MIKSLVIAGVLVLILTVFTIGGSRKDKYGRRIFGGRVMNMLIVMFQYAVLFALTLKVITMLATAMQKVTTCVVQVFKGTKKSAISGN